MTHRVFPSGYHGTEPGLSLLRTQGLPDQVTIVDGDILKIFYDFRGMPEETTSRLIAGLEEPAFQVGLKCFWMPSISEHPHGRCPIVVGLHSGNVWLAGESREELCFMNSSVRQLESCILAVRNWRYGTPDFDDQSSTLSALIHRISSIEPRLTLDIGENGDGHYWHGHLEGLVIDHELVGINLPWSHLKVLDSRVG